ncbi:MAG: proton-conducting transporter membrane subunit [Firmicutes bacterium]|nr:proton-conducting transporter membrane subunit [Bacillota bacterium]
MNSCFLLIAVLFPIVCGAVILPGPMEDRKKLYRYVGAVTLITSALTWMLILFCKTDAFTVLKLTEDLSFALRFDGLGRFFTGIIATLWPLTVLYATEYMEEEERLPAFFAFFTIAYGVTLGVAMAGNLFTMYVFYEMLTLSTLPLVMHTLTRKAIRAAKTYLVYSLGGAAFAFASIMYLIGSGCSGIFRFGGMLEAVPAGNENRMRIFYLFGFFGFGVKAAVFPLERWLPKASVAPTPVTALLHAVAVVKSGVFAVIRLTYFAFGTGMLQGSWAQNTAMCIAVFTIFYGATRAVKETHWKRRLAYSTVANLSYILFGVTMMTEAGLTAGLLHMAFHAEIKILAFFCAGAVLHRTGREYLQELEGLGRKMPVTFGCFTVAALALTGIPPFSGFVSKWYLLTAAAASGNPLAYAGAGVLLFGALLTAMYMLTVVCRAWFPGKDRNVPEDVGEVSLRMTIPMVLLAVGILLTGLFAGPIIAAAQTVAAGLF